MLVGVGVVVSRGGGAGAAVVALVAARLLAFPALRRGPFVEGPSRFGGSSLAAKAPRPPSPPPLSGVFCLGGWSARRFRCGSAVVGFRFCACARVHFCARVQFVTVPVLKLPAWVAVIETFNFLWIGMIPY